MQLSQYDIEEFKETCNKRVVAYFKKFDVWSGNFESQIIKIASEKEKELFQIVDSDWMLEIVKETEVNFVGLKPYFYPQRNAIIKALKEAETERLDIVHFYVIMKLMCVNSKPKT